MKKIISVLFVFMSIITLSGCQSPSSTTSSTTNVSEEKIQNVTVSLSKDGKEFESKDISAKQGQTLMDIMKDNFEIEQEDGFITAINDVKQDTQNSKYWMFTVNDEVPSEGAEDITLSNNDKINFNLEGM